MKKIAIVSLSKYRCYMNAATRKAYGIDLDCNEKNGFRPPLREVEFHGHRARKGEVVEIHQAPLTVSRLLQTLGREDILFLDAETMNKLGCKPGNKVRVQV